MTTIRPIATATQVLRMVAHLSDTYDSATSLSKASDWAVGGHGMELSVSVSPDNDAGGWSVSVLLYLDGIIAGESNGWSESDHQDARAFLRSGTVLATVLRAVACAERTVGTDPS